MQEIRDTNLTFKTNIFYVEELDKTFINIQMVTDYGVTEKTFSYFGRLLGVDIEKEKPKLLRKTLKRHIKTVNSLLL